MNRLRKPNQPFKEISMNVFSKVNLGVLVTTLLLSFSFAVPQAQAHACNGRGTITIKEVKKNEYWYFQSGRVCGRYVA